MNELYEDEIFNEGFVLKSQKVTNKTMFKNCTFIGKCELKGITHSKRLTFYGCKFKSNFEIQDCSIDLLDIHNCNFDIATITKCKSSYLTIKDIKAEAVYINGIYEDFYLGKNEIKECDLKDMNSEYALHESEFIIKDNKIDRLNIFSSSLFANITFIKGVYNWITLKGMFNETLVFQDNVNVEYLFFESSIFNRIDIKSGDYQNVNFQKSTFKNLVIIDGIDILENSKKELTIKRLGFYSNNFEQNVS
ncbi:hypothetical protein, partial [Winogradskyella sp.]|uniref:hypothetical protein n=1 Tax=Winogradskyella sp. TaxID=1883156 RepID=UPI001B2CBB58